MQPQRISWMKASLGLATMGTIIVILFIVLNNPFNTIIDMIDEEATDFGVSSDVDPFLTMILTIFGLVFALSMAGLITWFFLSSHETEHEQYTEDSPYQNPPGGNFY